MLEAKSGTPLSPLVWLQSFVIDGDKLDRQHRKLMTDINELTDLLFAGRPWASVIAKCEELREDSFEHFRTEEEVLTRLAYAEATKHGRYHRDLETRLDDIVGHLWHVKQPRRAHIEAALYLRSMLIDHFFRKDIAYKSHVLRSQGM